MKIKLIGRDTGALRKRLREVQGDMDPKSRKMDRLRTELKKITVKDNEDKLYRGGSAMAGVDYRGKPLAPPAASTVKGWTRKGLIRQILAPHGLGSRAITKFFVEWQLVGSKGWRMVRGWKDCPWMIYHLEGRAKGSKGVDRLGRNMAKWSLPQRDIDGTTPAGWAKYRAEFKRFMRTVIKGR